MPLLISSHGGKHCDCFQKTNFDIVIGSVIEMIFHFICTVGRTQSIFRGETMLPGKMLICKWVIFARYAQTHHINASQNGMGQEWKNYINFGIIVNCI